MSASCYADMSPGLVTVFFAFVREAIYVTLGEEILFRELFGGWAMRRFNFQVGNVIQAAVFLLPHLPLLVILGPGIWPVLLFPLFAGWLLGWLRYAYDSILSGWLIHSIANAVPAALSMAG